jgi:hypothetical protein
MTHDSYDDSVHDAGLENAGVGEKYRTFEWGLSGEIKPWL